MCTSLEKCHKPVRCGTSEKCYSGDDDDDDYITLHFPLPLSYSAPSLPVFPLEFRAEVNRQETRVMGLSSSEDRMIVAGVVLT